MNTKVSVTSRWWGPVPQRNGKPLPKNHWARAGRKRKWVVRWFAPDVIGKVVRRSRTFRTRSEAELFQAKKQAEFDLSPQARRIARLITISEFTAEFELLRTGPRGQRLKASSLRVACQSLERFARFI